MGDTVEEVKDTVEDTVEEVKDEVKEAAKKVTDSDTYLGSDDERKIEIMKRAKGSNESRGHSKT